jgi:hypothetical protein
LEFLPIEYYWGDPLENCQEIIQYPLAIIPKSIQYPVVNVLRLLNTIDQTANHLSFAECCQCPFCWLWAEVGKVTLKSNGDEALSNESLKKSNGDEALNNDFS